VEIPDAYRYLWNWYFALSNTLLRIKDGTVIPIAPTEFRAWCESMGLIVYPTEYAILCAMDEAFCRETAEEVKAFQARDADRRARETQTPKPKARRARNGK